MEKAIESETGAERNVEVSVFHLTGVREVALTFLDNKLFDWI